MDTFGYGVGQGSIGVECRADDEETIKMLKTITDETSAQLCMTERTPNHIRLHDQVIKFFFCKELDIL
ncbi:hypothetical protein DD238_007771 [Peronospora effusa]|uniref:Uncharacterized protein n=1 Tax=Peronospora effusa TaxID=542832 RepID=A0A3M6V8Y9_9STRA|nr:hypothetical protein DD238_007771 [Peronospora effusa]